MRWTAFEYVVLAPLEPNKKRRPVVKVMADALLQVGEETGMGRMGRDGEWGVLSATTGGTCTDYIETDIGHLSTHACLRGRLARHTVAGASKTTRWCVQLWD